MTWEDIIKAIKCPKCGQRTFKYIGHLGRESKSRNAKRNYYSRKNYNMMECSNPECGHRERIV